jgi:hypothetical protein
VPVGEGQTLATIIDTANVLPFERGEAGATKRAAS